MPNVTITYFNLKGLAEGIRMLLAYGGQKFEDKRISMEEWPEMKWETPFGSLPVVEVDGTKYTQSLAICRFLGKKYGLAGDTPTEDLVIDQNMDFFNDVRNKIAMAFFESDENLKARKLEDVRTNQLPQLLPRMEKIIKENNGHIAAGKLTWADFAFAGFYDAIKVLSQMSDMDEKYPVFKQLQDTVTSLPKVKEYCAAAPQTPF